MREKTPWRGRLIGLLLILAISNLAPSSSNTQAGFQSLRSGNCCVAVRESIFQILDVSNAVLKSNPGATVGTSLRVALDPVSSMRFYLLWDPKGNTVEEELAVKPVLHHDDPKRSESRIRSPGFQNVEIVADADLTRVSETEYFLEATTAEQFIGFNVKEYLGVEATPYDVEGRELERDSSIIYRSYVQIRGFGHHIRMTSGSPPVVQSNQPASVVVSVYDPGEEPTISQEDWEFAGVPATGYERFLSGELEIRQGFPDSASAQIHFQANAAGLPGSSGSQRVPILVSATAEGRPSVSERFDLFLIGD